MRKLLTGLTLLAVQMLSAQTFQLTPDGYFNQGGVDVMAFSDFYPEWHVNILSKIY